MQFHENKQQDTPRSGQQFHFGEFDISIGIAVITCVLSYLHLENRQTCMKLIFKYLKRNVRRCLDFYLVHFKLYVGEQ